MPTRMRRSLSGALALIITAALVLAPAKAAFAATTPPAPDLAALAGTAATNAFRNALGLPEVATNAALAAAAKSHSQYIIAHNVIGHYENASDADSTGNSPADRAAHFGYNGWAGEVLNQVWSPLTAGASAQIWIDTLYHRIPFVDARIRAAGLGLASGSNGAYAATEDFGAMDWSYSFGRPVVYPRNGQTMVPTSWNGLESPNPLRLFAGALDDKGNPTGPTGPVLTASIIDGDVRTISVTDSSLRGADGSAPAYWTLSSDNDDELRETASLIPKAPLKPDTTYTVRIAGSYTKGWTGVKKTFDVTWSFHTAQAGTVTNSQLSGSWDAAKGAYQWTLTVTGQGLATASKVYFGGLPYPVQHQSDGSLRVQLGATYSLTATAGLEVEWPDGSTATNSWYWNVDAAKQIKPVLGTATVTVGGQQRSVQWASYGTSVWTEASARLLPDAQFQNTGDVHMMKYGDHIVEWAGGSRSAYVDGVLSPMPYAPLSSGGVNYLPAAWLDGLLKQWTGDSNSAGGSSGDGANPGSGGTPAPVSFTDISGHWAKTEILRLAGLGIVAGNGDGTFQPDSRLTRAAFVKMLTGARSLQPQPGNAAGFADTASHWVAQQGYLGAAVAAGIIKPGEYPGNRFDPDREITRDEIAILIVRALGLDAQAQATKVTMSGGRLTVDGVVFSDAAQWANPGYVVTAIRSGIVHGYDEADGSKSFRPARTATRAEAVTMIVRMLDSAE